MQLLKVDVTVHPNPFVAAAMCNGIIAAGRRAGGIRLIPHYFGERDLVDALSKSAGDAFIGLVYSEEEAVAVRKLRRVAVGMMAPELHAILPQISLDHRAIGTMAAEHLMDQGYQRFAFVGANHAFSIGRFEGFRARVAREGFDCVVHSLRKDGTFPTQDQLDKRAGFEAFLRGLARPVGIMVASDMSAVTLLEVAEAIGIKVPDEVGVIGVDNNPLRCELAPVQISSVDIDPARVGMEAARLVYQLAAGKSPPASPVLIPPGKVVARASTDWKVVSDEEVRRAMELIESEPRLGVNEIAGRLHLSRSTLERRFRQAVGKSPGEHLNRVRLRQAMDLLESTDLELGTISRRCGFAHLPGFSHWFKMQTDLAPSVFRRSRGKNGEP
jgi:LacI family transcriptional regulator